MDWQAVLFVVLFGAGFICGSIFEMLTTTRRVNRMEREMDVLEREMDDLIRRHP